MGIILDDWMETVTGFRFTKWACAVLQMAFA